MNKFMIPNHISIKANAVLIYVMNFMAAVLIVSSFLAMISNANDMMFNSVFNPFLRIAIVIIGVYIFNGMYLYICKQSIKNYLHKIEYSDGWKFEFEIIEES